MCDALGHVHQREGWWLAVRGPHSPHLGDAVGRTMGLARCWRWIMSDTETQLIEEMFVQLATGVTTSKESLTLVGVSPSTLYFSDRPERVVGHMTTEQFVEEWNEGADSFASDPPNAVLSFVEAGADTPSDVVVVLREPTIGDESLSYAIEVLDGDLPGEAGPCTLFIDPLGRPLSPVSVAGMHRRDRRRMRRRI